MKEGWEAYSDDEGEIYYHHLESGETTYDHPGVEGEEKMLEDHEMDMLAEADNLLQDHMETKEEDDEEGFHQAVEAHAPDVGGENDSSSSNMESDDAPMSGTGDKKRNDGGLHPRKEKAMSREYYVVKFKDRTTESTPYWTPEYTRKNMVAPDTVVTMRDGGYKLHGEVNRLSIVRGIKYIQDPKFLNLGTGIVPTGPIKAGTKQELRLTKLLPLTYLQRVENDRLLRATVTTTFYVNGAPHLREATIEDITAENTITLAFARDDITLQEPDLEHTQVGRVLRDVLQIVKPPFRRFRVVKPQLEVDEPRNYDNLHPWLSQVDSGKGQVSYNMLVDEHNPAAGYKVVGPLEGDPRSKHGTVDVGTVVCGSHSRWGGEEYLDCGTGLVPTGPLYEGEQEPEKRKFLPFKNLVEISDPGLLVESNVDVFWGDETLPNLLVDSWKSTDQTLKVSEANLKEFKNRQRYLDVSINDIARVTCVAPIHKRSISDLLHEERDLKDEEVYSVSFEEENIKVKFALHPKGFPVVAVNDNDFERPYLRDAVIAMNGKTLFESNDPVAEVTRMVKTAPRPLAITFIHMQHNEYAKGDFDENDTYVVWFKEEKLNLNLSTHRHGFPVVMENNNTFEKPYARDAVIAINGIMLHESSEPYEEMMHMLKTAGRPVRITFVTRDALRGGGQGKRAKASTGGEGDGEVFVDAQSRKPRWRQKRWRG